VRISTAQGTTLYNLSRKEDGSLSEFKPQKISQTYRNDKKNSIKDEKFGHKKTVSMVPAIPTPKTIPSLNLDASVQPPKSDFFRLVNQMLDDQHRQHFEDKEKAKNDQELTMNNRGKSKLKMPIKKVKKRSSIDLKPLKPEEKAILLEYEHEILGNYTSSESIVF